LGRCRKSEDISRLNNKRVLKIYGNAGCLKRGNVFEDLIIKKTRASRKKKTKTIYQTVENAGS